MRNAECEMRNEKVHPPNKNPMWCGPFFLVGDGALDNPLPLVAMLRGTSPKVGGESRIRVERHKKSLSLWVA